MNFQSTLGKPLGLAAAATLTLGLATAATGFVAFATPAGAATGPTATLRQGTVTVTGTAARDLIGITIDADQLAVDFGLDGTVDAQFKRSRVTAVVVNAGAGDDQIVAGTPGPITVNAGAGDDSVNGGGAAVGQEIINLGDGNDRFVSSLNAFFGARSDIVDGGTGQNTMRFDGTFASEAVTLSANAGHLIVDQGIDAVNIQDVTWLGFGGNDEGGGDQVTVNDLSGTDVVNFTPNFSAPSDGTAPNNSADQVRVVGTEGDDHITVGGSGANITVAGLTPTVTPVLLDAQDTLRIDTLNGKDTVTSHDLQRGLVQLQVF